MQCSKYMKLYKENKETEKLLPLLNYNLME